jgi:hypothetical protein
MQGGPCRLVDLGEKRVKFGIAAPPSTPDVRPGDDLRIVLLGGPTMDSGRCAVADEESTADGSKP